MRQTILDSLLEPTLDASSGCSRLARGCGLRFSFRGFRGALVLGGVGEPSALAELESHRISRFRCCSCLLLRACLDVDLTLRLVSPSPLRSAWFDGTTVSSGALWPAGEPFVSSCSVGLCLECERRWWQSFQQGVHDTRPGCRYSTCNAFNGIGAASRRNAFRLRYVLKQAANRGAFGLSLVYSMQKPLQIYGVFSFE